MTMRTMNRKVVLGAVAALLLAGCQDLVVENQNAPDRHRALRNAGDVETLVVSAWRDKWGRLHNSASSVNVIPLIADEMSGTYANNGALELSSEPRVPLNNNPIGAAHDTGRFQWADWYKAVSSVSDGLGAIAGGLRIRTGDDGGDVQDNTTRAWAWSKWMQGISLGHLGMLFDKAYIVNEFTNLEEPENVPLLEYDLVRDTAIAYLLQAADTMMARPFVIPDSWIPSRQYTSEQLARIAHSYIARFLVYGARTPEERAALNWNKVIEHIDKGIREDYEADLQSGVLTSASFNRFQNTGTFSAYGDYMLIGPADVAGNWKAWLDKPLEERERFLITTPDRRITGATPTSNGGYFRYYANNIFVPERGLYHHSHYQWRRHIQQWGGTTLSSTGVAKLVTVDEMNLLKAEALMYLGRNAEAAELVNITRTRPVMIGTVQHPGLPPVTAQGVPQSADCVPRMDGVNCADLKGALMYERMIEGTLLDILRAYVDSRGWGRLPEGTFIHFPIPGRELEASGLPMYSFGGIGGPGAAKCTWAFCTKY
jgi:hypothetical protein